jgi:hypothetical protein
MDAKQTRRRFSDLQFRVLVIGRANAGKTSILQRVCETTESPTIYRGNEEVRGPTFCLQVGSHPRQVTLTPSMNVSSSSTSLRSPLNMKLARRALHRRCTCVLQSQGLCISRFAGHRSRRRREARNLETIHSAQLWRKASGKQVACDMVWAPVSTTATTDDPGFRYCVPMDDHRPGLNLRFFRNVCPDQNGSSS